MSRRARVGNSRLSTLAATALATVAAVCGGDPAGPTAGGSGVAIDLAPYFSGAGRICDDEADTVTLTVTEAGPPLRVQQKSEPVPENCIVEFDDVSVDSGMVGFSAAVTGKGRPLLVGDTLQLIERDGFVVQPRLSPVPALVIRANSIGTAPDTVDILITPAGRDRERVSVADLPETFYALAAGVRQIDVFAGPCDVQPAARLTVEIPTDPDSVPKVDFTVFDCPVGSISVTTATTGSGGPAHYTVVIGGGGQPDTSITIAPKADSIVDEILIGAREVKLDSVRPCMVTPPNPQTVTVTEGGQVRADFVVDCPGPSTGTIEVVTTTMGSGGPTGYFYSLDSGPPQPIGPNAIIPLTDVPAGPHTVELTGLASCVLDSMTMNPQDVTVPDDDIVQALFPVKCTGAIEIETTTIGTGGPADYTVVIGGGGQPDTITIAPNATIQIDVPAGIYRVELTGFEPCMLTLRTVNPLDDLDVTAGTTVQAPFEVDCSSANEATLGLSSLIDAGLWSNSSLVDPRRRWWYAARSLDKGPRWTM